MDLEGWRRLPENDEVSAASLDIERWLRADRDPTRDALGSDIGVRLAERWRDVADRALASRDMVTEWVTRSTLIACTPGDVADGTFLAEATREADTRGARYPAAIYPARDARGTRWTAYRSWFAHADALDAGDLRAAAVTDPDGALDAATVRVPADVVADRDETGLWLSVGAFATTIDAVGDAFIGLMRGFTPEQTFTAAIAEAAERLRRTDALLTRLRSALGVDQIRFADGVPAYRVGDVVVVDPLAGGFLAGGELHVDWPDRLTSALAPRLSPPCTCLEDRVVRATLGVRGADGALAMAVDDDLELRFVVACPHDVRTPSGAEWSLEGIDVEDAGRRWHRTATETLWHVAEAAGPAAVLFYGPDAAALLADDVLASAVVAACGHAAGVDATAVALAANVVLVCDPGDDPPDVDLGSFEHAGFEPGETVRFVRRVRSAGTAEPRLRTAPLGLRT